MLANNSEQKWYVMLHLSPKLIEKQLLYENEQRLTEKKPPLQYFIPYHFIGHAVPEQHGEKVKQQTEQARRSNELRDDLRNFVFIKGDEQQMYELVDKPWNTDGRLHLRFYKSKSGTPITVKPEFMQPFITLCCEHRQRFSIGPTVQQQISKQDLVYIRHGLFKDFPATVIDVQSTATGISLTLGVSMFEGTKTLLLHDYSPEDIRKEKGAGYLFSTNFILEVEEQLLHIFRQRVNHYENTPARRLENATTLDDLFHYSYITLSDTALHQQFRTLMLWCATMRKDILSIESITNEVQGFLADKSVPTNDNEAFMMAVLFLATKKADYRTAVKNYRNEHPACKPNLQLLTSLITRVRNR